MQKIGRHTWGVIFSLILLTASTWFLIRIEGQRGDNIFEGPAFLIWLVGNLGFIANVLALLWVIRPWLQVREKQAIAKGAVPREAEARRHIWSIVITVVAFLAITVVGDLSTGLRLKPFPFVFGHLINPTLWPAFIAEFWINPVGMIYRIVSVGLGLMVIRAFYLLFKSVRVIEQIRSRSSTPPPSKPDEPHQPSGRDDDFGGFR